MKEKILNAMKSLGFLIKEDKEFCYCFRYEGKPFQLQFNEEDEEFLAILLKTTVSVDDENDVGFYQFMNKINGVMKFVKAKMDNGSMWLSYERELLGDEDLMQMLANMIFHLNDGFDFLYRLTPMIEKYSDAISDESDTDTEKDNKDDAE